MLTIEAHLQEKDKKDKSVAWHLVTSFMGDEFQLPARFKVTEQWKDKEHSNFRLARNKKKKIVKSPKKAKQCDIFEFDYSMHCSRCACILFYRYLNFDKARDQQDNIRIKIQQHFPLWSRVCLTFLLHQELSSYCFLFFVFPIFYFFSFSLSS